MSDTLRNWILTGILSMILTHDVIKWVDNVDDLLIPSTVEDIQGIRNIEVEFNKGSILLNIYLSKPLSCGQVITTLGIQSLPMEDKIYIPDCEQINTEYIKITYTESITI